jgi:hypothetical protein
MKKIFLIFILALTSSLFALENYIGFTPKEIIDELGAPSYVLSQRGERTEEDDVLFFYDDRVYVYFNQNRVWQIRVDQSYTGSILNLNLGDDKSVVLELLGEPLDEKDNSLIYRRPDKGYPMILRIYFSGDKLNDIYFYRGDY